MHLARVCSPKHVHAVQALADKRCNNSFIHSYKCTRLPEDSIPYSRQIPPMCTGNALPRTPSRPGEPQVLACALSEPHMYLCDLPEVHRLLGCVANAMQPLLESLQTVPLNRFYSRPTCLPLVVRCFRLSSGYVTFSAQRYTECTRGLGLCALRRRSPVSREPDSWDPVVLAHTLTSPLTKAGLEPQCR